MKVSSDNEGLRKVCSPEKLEEMTSAGWIVVGMYHQRELSGAHSYTANGDGAPVLIERTYFILAKTRDQQVAALQELTKSQAEQIIELSNKVEQLDAELRTAEDMEGVSWQTIKSLKEELEVFGQSHRENRQRMTNLENDLLAVRMAIGSEKYDAITRGEADNADAG